MTLAHFPVATLTADADLNDFAAADLGELATAVLEVLARLAEPADKDDTAASAAYRARAAATQLVTTLEDLDAADADLQKVQRLVAEHLPPQFRPYFRPGLKSVSPDLAVRWLGDTLTAIDDLIGVAQQLTDRITPTDPDLAKRARTALLVAKVGTDHVKTGHR